MSPPATYTSSGFTNADFRFRFLFAKGPAHRLVQNNIDIVAASVTSTLRRRSEWLCELHRNLMAGSDLLAHHIGAFRDCPVWIDRTRATAEIEADRPIAVSFLPRAEALADDDLIRTKVNLIPEAIETIRVVDIVGLDKQADGGTHVASTKEVGRFDVTKTESKGKGNKRVRIQLS